MELSLIDLLERVKEKYDPDELVDLLRLTSEDLLRAFPHRLSLLRENFASEEYWEGEAEGEDD
jgi:hypothetical protein